LRPAKKAEAKMPAKPQAASENHPRFTQKADRPPASEKAFKGEAASGPATFVVREYSFQRGPRPAGDPTDGETLYWHPLLLTGADGRATLEFDLPDRPATFHVTVDAHTVDGRVGSARQQITAAP
jgi:hypothetical protein